ncbi:MAG: hypothetical protein ACPGU4_12485 [Flavobacteriales bacterium]
MNVETLLKELQELQSSGDSIYPKGIFPSQRYHPFLPYERQDDNLFFTNSIVKILQDVRSTSTENEQNLIDAICLEAIASYSLFRNKNGLDTYNFWQTKPSRHFPNGMFMNRFKHFQIPDDVDDTALTYLTEGAKKQRVEWLRNKLKLHANLAYKKAFNPLPKYQNLKCYSTFFGEKMYIEFDVCVLSNLMSLILKQTPEDKLNAYDLDTLEFVCSVIENDEHISCPFYSAPNYPTTELILYHLARLIPVLPSKWKNRIEKKVKSDIGRFLPEASGLNRVLLQNAAIKLDISISDTNDFDKNLALEDKNFFFFHAGMITAFENRLAQSLASNSFFHLRYKSKALNRALLIENMLLKRSLTAEVECQSA